MRQGQTRQKKGANQKAIIRLFCHDGGWKKEPQEIKNGRPRFSRDLPSLEFQIDRCNYHCMDTQKANPRCRRVLRIFFDLG